MDLPPPVGRTTSESRPPTMASMASRWRGRKEVKPQYCSRIGRSTSRRIRSNPGGLYTQPMADRHLLDGRRQRISAPDPSETDLDDLRALVTMRRTHQSDCGQ